MTCIVGVTHNGSVYFGGDSATSHGFLIREGKVWVHGLYVLGGSGDNNKLNQIRYRYQPPHPIDGQDLTAFMHTGFSDSLKDLLDEETTLMVGIRGRIFRFMGGPHKIVHCFESIGPYESTGSGAGPAMGALFVMFDGADGVVKGKDPNEYVRRALEAAENENRTFVQRPFTFVRTP